MTSFSGFPRQSIQFITELELNNNKAWFSDNRDVFDRHVMPEAQSFVMELGSLLRKKIAPEIQAIPKTDKSVFRLHRDVRFSKDKNP